MSDVRCQHLTWMMSTKRETDDNWVDIRRYHELNLVTPGQHSSKAYGFEELITLGIRQSKLKQNLQTLVYCLGYPYRKSK